MRESAKSTDKVEPFEALLAPVWKVAYSVAYRLTNNSSDAEDLIQEAALLAFRHFDSFEQGTNFKAWFLRILTNCFLTKTRARKRRPTTVNLDDLPDLYLYRQTADAGLHVQSEDPASLVMRHMKVEQVAAALHALPEEYRVVSSLYFMEDLSYQEIAECLSCPVGTVRSRLHRGRKMLQSMLWSIALDAGIVDELSNTEGKS